MRITQLLTENTIILDLKAGSKREVLDELAGQLDRAGKLNDKKQFTKDILAREEQSTTGIGDTIAIPHAKSEAVKTPAIAFGRSFDGIDFESLDGQPAQLFFMIAATAGANDDHLEALSRLATFLMDEKFRVNIIEAESKQQVLDIVSAKEAEVDGPEQADDSATVAGTAEPAAGGKILAVTACPTGIAHTYMAAEKLNGRAKERGINLKVETNGSSGVKNRLTDAEIAEADAIIVAADTKVEMARFDGKHVIQTQVGKAIYEADQLLDRALAKDAPVYKHDRTKDADAGTEPKSGFYKHLMNGVSNMLPFVVGGGILIALSFFFGINAADPDSPEYNEFAAMLSTIGGGTAFFLMVPVLAGFIAMSIADRPGFAPGMIGGLLAITVTGVEEASGGSGFLGGLIAGFLAGYVTLLVKKVFSGIPQSLEGLKPVLFYPVFSILITGVIMMLINPPLTQVYTGISAFLESLGGTNLVLVGLLLGGMMAVDMGGPVNKAAYTFGIAMLDAQNFNFMATVMAAGMVPPLGLAIATTMFKKKFTKPEREAGKTAYVLGASFITEGVIPFAAADPARVIPSAIAGAATTGALVMLFDIGLRAPHGGVFVIGLVDGGMASILMYLIAILAGSFVTAILVGLLKKNITAAA
ncbi:PTS fructose transporter subunit IIABC [Planococcus citreus]|uniref:PTS system D-fructose-specific IIA component (F1P-forming) (Frc family) /PTS system D-fructose-specific IIB component (F1P-forming) (Frc family) /PTS system D-fructose-specific IIC component (F1P-f... n=1 Tax=Planococcus citreus TaxID=1373 RepID=A0A497YIF5_9BACL|nr:PTS fructose transporter subunit IIABC [Planococcus citreus]RLJ86917.1 PTS system D-fructose-specific IIA component (F1P-forming) (Frc family) /PTS system D-fructose-specific IIB component (F1P-forming) (Frc family) /PTS system D-fructose-specific IIC component (F1P-forming) (Frc family) [Planococcus citreus]